MHTSSMTSSEGEEDMAVHELHKGLFTQEFNLKCAKKCHLIMSNPKMSQNVFHVNQTDYCTLFRIKFLFTQQQS